MYSLDYAGYDATAHDFTYGLFPAEMYAMARLSAIQADPNSNYWRTALVDNLNMLNAGTAVTWYKDTPEDSSAAYDVARIAVAANYVNHADKTIWRDGVISLLSDLDDNAAAPVMAVGASVWALASTGDISADTRVVWPGESWEAQVKDLPTVLAALQAPDNTFYTKFDPELGYGFTETTAMGALGLMAADASSGSYLYSLRATLATGVLEAGVADPGGEVYWAINNPLSGAQYFLGGETLVDVPPESLS